VVSKDRRYDGKFVYAAITNGIIAFAPYDGTHIIVFAGRVRVIAKALNLQVLFGYVLVHEISHILEGICRHSESGFMKAQWDMSC
jgi:hypothetical protein